QLRALPGVQLVHLLAEQLVFAGPGVIEEPEYGEQGALPGSRRTHHRHELPGGDLQVDAPEQEDLPGALLDRFLDVAQSDHLKLLARSAPSPTRTAPQACAAASARSSAASTAISPPSLLPVCPGRPCLLTGSEGLPSDRHALVEVLAGSEVAPERGHGGGGDPRRLPQGARGELEVAQHRASGGGRIRFPDDAAVEAGAGPCGAPRIR